MRALNTILALLLAVACGYVGYTCTNAVPLWPLLSWGRAGMALLGVAGLIGAVIAVLLAIAIAEGEA